MSEFTKALDRVYDAITEIEEAHVETQSDLDDTTSLMNDTIADNEQAITQMNRYVADIKELNQILYEAIRMLDAVVISETLPPPNILAAINNFFDKRNITSWRVYLKAQHDRFKSEESIKSIGCPFCGVKPYYKSKSKVVPNCVCFNSSNIPIEIWNNRAENAEK